MMAPIALAAAGLAVRLKSQLFRPVAMASVLTLSVLTFHRAQVFATEENLLRDTLAKNPASSEAHNDLGVILARKKAGPEATAHFVAAVQSNPNHAGARLNLGQALALAGRFAEAEAHLRAAVKLEPADPLAHKCLAEALIRQGRNREAIVQLHLALCLKADTRTRLDLAGLLFQAGHHRRAAGQFRRALLTNPDLLEPLNNLAWLLATSADDTVRDGTQAIRHAERACRLTRFEHTGMISTLAAAYAEGGRFAEAVITAERAVRLQTANGETRLAAINNQLLPLYRAGRPYHEGSGRESAGSQRPAPGNRL
jgi:Flp pilus assembly protein TadD